MKYFNKPNKDPCWFIISYNDYNDQNTLTQIKLMNYNSDLPGGKQATKGDKNNNRYILYGLFPFVQDQKT